MGMGIGIGIGGRKLVSLGCTLLKNQYRQGGERESGAGSLQ